MLSFGVGIGVRVPEIGLSSCLLPRSVRAGRTGGRTTEERDLAGKREERDVSNEKKIDG